MMRALPRRALGKLGAGIVAAAVALGIALVPAASAQAADQILLSLDGRSWSSALAGTVFPRNVSLVPGTSINGTFFVRNASGSPAWVRVGVSKLIVTSPDLALSMNLTTIGTTTDAASGSTSRLSAGDMVCNDILGRGTPLPAGGIVRVDASLAFRVTVSGSTAQREAAQIDFIAELSDANLNALDVPLCDGTTTVGPVDPNGGGGTGGGGSGGGSGGGTSGGSGGSGTSGGSNAGTSGGAGSGADADGADSAADAFDGAAIGAINGGAFGIDTGDMPFNTVHWWEEYAILLLVIAALAGAIGRLVSQRRWEERDRRMGDA